MKKLLSHTLLLLGFLLIAFSAYLIYLRHSSFPLTFEKRPTSIHALSYITPSKIEIPSINIILPVIPAYIEDKKWDTTQVGVSFLATSPVPGQKGNSVFYGHNWTSLLGNLPQVKPGELIVITLQNGDKKRFQIEYTAIVNPDQTYIIDATNDSRITLYTCTGFLDSKRFVVVAKPIS